MTLFTAEGLLRGHAGLHEGDQCLLPKRDRLRLSALAIAQLGQGWVAEEAIAIVIYCALVAPSFKDGVLLAVNHDGDSDSSGAITGNLLGAMFGLSAIPEAWLELLELRDVITEVANDLYACQEWEIGECDINQEQTELIWEKYPGC